MASDKSFKRTDVRVGDCTVLQGAKILDIDDTGATVKFQSQTFKVTRYCLRKKLDEKDVGEVEGNPATGTADSWDGATLAEQGGGLKE